MLDLKLTQFLQWLICIVLTLDSKVVPHFVTSRPYWYLSEVFAKLSIQIIKQDFFF